MSSTKVANEPNADHKRRPACLSDFEVGEEIAWGSLATIVDAVHIKTAKKYAIKILNKMQLAKKKMVRSALVEKDALVALGTRPCPHPGIVRLHYCFHDPTNLYFVLDLATKGDLKSLTLQIGSLSLACARYYTAQMVDAILYMHEAGVAHRDIKPENCLLDESMRIKLADFGSAYVNPTGLDTERTNTFVGTAAFISPEVLGRSKTNPRGPDLWAVGCSLFFYIFGTYPFSAATDYLIMQRIKKLDFSIPEGCDPDAADLIRRLLVSSPDDRLGLRPRSSPAELRQHPFFVGRKSSSRDESASESRPLGGYIDWETLWEIPAPEAKPGPFQVRGKEDKADQELWTRFEDIRLIDE